MRIKKSPQMRKLSFVVGIIGAIFIIGLCVYFYNSSKKPVTISISSKAVTLNGLSDGKKVINLKDITGVSYITEKLNAEGIVMGGSVENKIFGYDKVNNTLDAYCYIENSNSPSILIKTKKNNYLVNTGNEKEIKNDYDKLKALGVKG